MATIDTLQVEITAITRDFNRQIDGVKGKINELGTAGEQSGKKLFAGFEGVGKAGATALKVGIVGAIAAITASIPAAVKRIDTLNNAPKVLQNLGYSAEDSEKAIGLLSKGIQGLPTRMDDAATALTAIASASGKGVLEATELTLAFNNMALAGGKGPAEAQRALVQFTQAIGRGKMGMQEFNTLSEVMPAQLAQVAKSLLGPTANAATLRDALSEGTVTMDDFMGEIIRLNKEGGPGFASFSAQAKDATAGIGTGFENMKTAISRGLVTIMKAIGSSNISAAIASIGTAFEGVLNVIAGLVSFIAANSDIFGPLTIGITAIIALLTAWHLATKAIIAAKAALWAVMALNPIGLIIAAITGIVAAIAYFVTQTETGRKVFDVAFNFIKNLAVAVWNTIKSVWSAVAGFFSGQFNAVQAVASAVINTISALFTGAYATVRGVWSAVSGFFSGQFNAVRSVTSSVVSAITSFFSSAWSNVRGIWSAASGFFSGVVGSIRGAISGIPSAFGSVFQSAWNQVTSIFGKIGSWFRGKAGEMVSAGRDMIAGLVRGLNPGPVIEKMKSIASSAIDTVKSFLGIKSPSRVMRDQVGKMMGLGLAEGIDQSTRNAVKSAAGSVRSVLGVYNGLSTDIPSTAQLSGRLDVAYSTKLSDASDTRPMHVTVMVGEDTLVDKIVTGINDRQFMSNGLIINV